MCVCIIACVYVLLRECLYVSVCLCYIGRDCIYGCVCVCVCVGVFVFVCVCVFVCVYGELIVATSHFFHSYNDAYNVHEVKLGPSLMQILILDTETFKMVMLVLLFCGTIYIVRKKIRRNENRLFL